MSSFLTSGENLQTGYTALKPDPPGPGKHWGMISYPELKL